jgi:hypothetical protein
MFNTKMFAFLPKERALQRTPNQRKEFMPNDFIGLRDELESRILARTGRRLQNLDINLSSNGVVLRGLAQTFYVKQLAQHGVRDLLPDIRLENAIQVA